MLLAVTTNQRTNGHWFSVDGVADEVCALTTGVGYWLVTCFTCTCIHILFVGVNLCVGLIYFKLCAV